MRAVVTGGAGFIGSHLIEALLARGDDVVCLERPGAPTGWVRGLRIEYAEAGIGDPDRLARAFAGADAVFHLAGLTAACRPAQFYAVNTDGTAPVVGPDTRPLKTHGYRVNVEIAFTLVTFVTAAWL